MTRNLRSIRSLFVFATIVAVAMICLGSLINFHQNKIWGKPLLTQMVAIKRDVEKISQDSHLIQKTVTGDCKLVSSPAIQSGAFTSESAYIAFSERVPALFCITSPGLRAPPAC
jgi:MFS-type transporter involved in bile tolerance (Atg22 family)